MKWENYTFYKTEMFKLTGTKQSPWIICDGNDKEKARKEAIRYVLNSIPYTKKGSTGERLTPNLSVIRIEDSFSQLK